MMDFTNPNDFWMNKYDPFKGMDEKDRMLAGCMQGITFLIMIVVALLLCLLFSGCTTTQYVPVPEYHTDTLMVTKHQRDSIWMHDSIHVWEGSDTVKIEKWHTKYVLNEIHDTLYQSKTDSIPYPVEVIKEVPAKLTWWQQTRIHIGGVVFWLLAFAAAWDIGGLLRKVKKKFLT